MTRRIGIPQSWPTDFWGVGEQRSVCCQGDESPLTPVQKYIYMFKDNNFLREMLQCNIWFLRISKWCLLSLHMMYIETYICSYWQEQVLYMYINEISLSPNWCRGRASVLNVYDSNHGLHLSKSLGTTGTLQLLNAVYWMKGKSKSV